MKYFLFLFLSVSASMLAHGQYHLTIVPKVGTTLPTEITPGYDIDAYYTVANGSSKYFHDLYVRSLPLHVAQVTTNGTYADTCPATFDLAPGESCTLQLLVSYPADGRLCPRLTVCEPGRKSYCAGTSSPLEVSLAPWVPISSSFEIGYTANVVDHPKSFVQAYKEGGTNPITSEEWTDYEPPSGYTKNTTRYLQFNESISLGGPGDPIGTETYITTSDGYTWGIISNVISAMWPYDASQYTFPSNLGTFYAGNLTVTPPPGVIKMSANYKAQLMKYYANENGVPPGTPGAQAILRYFITDQWGNEYIMQASDYDTPDEVTASFQAAVLPAGWTKDMRYLTEDFILFPATGPANTFEYVLLRDNQNNTYDQITWNASGTTVASQIQETGMPIWGGLSADVIRVSNSFDNLIYGGGGATSFIFPSSLTGGTNTIAGFDPFLPDTLDFDGQTYTAVILPHGVEIYLSGGATVLLEGVYIFSDDWVVN
ncbi:MAG: hypothetical protein LLF94_04075 [Chlamydiales bacterium]|nr:hypothetical protein [Chlamydiales bacterium]